MEDFVPRARLYRRAEQLHSETLLLFTSDNFTPQLPSASYIWLVVVKKAPEKLLFASVAASAIRLLSPNVHSFK